MLKNNDKEKIMPIGGQAVIEGVMMRSRDRIATAIRRANGKIEIKVQNYRSVMQRKKYLNIPIIRGGITLIELMVIGIKTLQWSADRAMDDIEAAETDKKKKKKAKKEKGMSTFSAFLTITSALLLGMGIFFVLPLYLTTKLFNIEREALAFNLAAGSIRIIFFILYIWLISFMKDIRRLFQYHGAEHKTVYAFENKTKLTPRDIMKYSTFHPRCGTSFLVIVMLVSLLFFALVDTLVMMAYGRITFLMRLAFHLPLIPVVAGFSYEALKASAKNLNNIFVKILISPGLWLQRITTRQPDAGQLEVSIAALQAALKKGR